MYLCFLTLYISYRGKIQEIRHKEGGRKESEGNW